MFLVEKLPNETPEDVGAFLEQLVRDIYGRRPDWLQYDLRHTYSFRGRAFVQMFCPAGSVHARIHLHASTGEGLKRDFLELGSKQDGRPIAVLLHRGQESRYGLDEIEKIG
jgi:hypothetical protein